MTIKVISALPLGDADRQKIERVFNKKFAKTPHEYAYSIDEKIIGGILVIAGDKYYDGTINGQLCKLSTHAVGADTASKVTRAQDAETKKTSSKTNKSTATKKVKTAKTADQYELLKDNSLYESVGTYERDFNPKFAGSVVFAGDGVVHIDGLSGAKYGEMLTVSDNLQAIVLSLNEDNVGAIVLDDDDKIAAHMIAKSTGRIVSVPVGEQLLGRVVNPLGKPIDGRAAYEVTKVRPIEAPAPAIKDRGKVDVPLETGILAVDSMIPIGRGQRELIIGDRQTGKTSIAIDTILNQKGKNVICVYVAIGQKASSVANIVKTLTDHGAMNYSVVVCATARDSSPLQYIAPYAGCAIAEEFMHQGKDVLIVYDDLSKHAVAYRAMSLLLKRPPGREAYPGDIFYLHSRLLERAARLNDENGGGSITALPIVETLAGDISAYIPTNIISITDGQIYLESDLFNSGVRPAINVGLSVSRVGSSAQRPSMRKIAGRLRLVLSQFRELETFSRFGADLDPSTVAVLEHGKRTVEVLKQDVHHSMDIAHEILVLYVSQKGLLKNVPTERVTEFNNAFVKFFEVRYPQILNELSTATSVSVATSLTIDDAVDEFTEFFKHGHNSNTATAENGGTK